MDTSRKDPENTSKSALARNTKTRALPSKIYAAVIRRFPADIISVYRVPTAGFATRKPRKPLILRFMSLAERGSKHVYFVLFGLIQN